jgi:hypothetical protein
VPFGVERQRAVSAGEVPPVTVSGSPSKSKSLSFTLAAPLL